MTTIAASKIATIGASIGATLPNGALDPILDPNNPDLLAMYTMDRISGATLEDESPNSVNGTITGATAVPGHIDNALMFDAGTEKVDFGDVVDFTTGNFSLWAWVNTSDATKNKGVIQKREVATGTGYLLGVATGGTVFAFVDDPGLSDVTASSIGTVNDGSYHLIGANFDRSGDMTAYIDGSADGIASMSGVSGSLANTGALVLGNISSFLGTSVTSYIGDIDQVRIFDRILTQSEIDALFNGGVGA